MAEAASPNSDFACSTTPDELDSCVLLDTLFPLSLVNPAPRVMPYLRRRKHFGSRRNDAIAPADLWRCCAAIKTDPLQATRLRPFVWWRVPLELLADARVVRDARNLLCVGVLERLQAPAAAAEG
jgi:hypothetical protein